MKFNWSYSSASIYKDSPKWWLLQNILRAPKSDIVIQTYGIAGNIPHKFLENRLKGVIDNNFLEMWKKAGLNNMLGFNGKPLNLPSYIKAKENGLQILKNYRTLGYTLEPEMKFLIPYDKNINWKGFIDVVAKKGDVVKLLDYKTSSKKVKGEFDDQMLFYSWLYYLTTGKVPDECIWYYIKIDKEAKFKPTLKKIKEFEKEQIRIIEEIKSRGTDITKYPFGDYDSVWNGYKTKMDSMKNAVGKLTINIEKAKIFIVNPPMDLQIKLAKEFSYEKKAAFFAKRAAKKKGYEDDGIKRFFKIKDNSLPLGFLMRLIKFLKNNKHNLNIVDKRAKLKEYNMPHKLLDREPFPHQAEAINFIMNRKILSTEIVTGVGKTTIGAEVIRRNKGLSLFIVDRNVLLTQTVRSFEGMFGEDIGVIRRGVMDLKKITVANVQTLNSLIKKKDKLITKYLANVKTLIIDEAHGSATKSYTRVGDLVLNANIRLGLTGTYERTDGAEMDIESVVGGKDYIIKPQEMIKEGYLMNPNIWFFRYDYVPVMPKKEIDTDKLTEMSAAERKKALQINYHNHYTPNITENKTRNDLFLKLLNKFPDKNIMIITSEKEHGRSLQKLIPDSVFIEGKVDDKTRDKWIQQMRDGKRKIIIGTASIIQKGLDIPQLEVGFNLTGNASPIITKQFLGRILRTCEDKEQCWYIDFYDSGEYFEDHSEERILTLKKEGYKVKIFSKPINSEK